MWHDLTATSTAQGPGVGHYELLHTIGRGGFAEVSLARHVLSGSEVAVKAIPRQGSYGLLTEVQCMRVLNHPNIVKLFEVIHTEDTLFLVMEHVGGGDLCDYLEDCGHLSENEARGLFRQVVSAVEYCHRRGVVHRDLKPQNVLLDAELNIKLADFGLSKHVTGQKQLSTFCGSLPYIAPKLYLGKSYDGPKSDMWSLGVLLYEMLTGTRPFQRDNIWALRKRILDGRYHVPSFLSSECRNFLRRLLTVNPSHQETLPHLMKDPWLHLGPLDELRPYIEPPADIVYPWVTEAMVAMGFERDLIHEAVTHRTYDNVMATYLILRSKKPTGKVRTIRVQAGPALDWSSPGPSPARQLQPSGHEAKQPASLQSTSSSPQRCPESASGTAQPGPGSASGTARPGPGSASGTARPGPAVRTGTLQPSPEPRTTTPQLGPESRTEAPQPGSESWTATGKPGPGFRTATPHPDLESSTVTSHLGPRSGTTTPQPGLESRTEPPQLSPESRTTNTRPDLEFRTTTPQPGPESTIVTPQPGPESRTTTTRPDLESRTTTPQLGPESRTTTPKPDLESMIVTTLSDLESRTTTPQPGPESTIVTPQPGPESRTRAPQPGCRLTARTLQNAGQPKSVSSAASSGCSQGCRRAASRLLTLLLRTLRSCTSTKKHIKKNRVKPL